jgi:hypothetical protein
MTDHFAVAHLDVERLLSQWRWLCPNRMSLVARDAFGNLFLRDEAGQIHRLDVAIGKLSRLTDSEAQFRELASVREEEWFAERDEGAAAAKGLTPDDTQCIGFSVPLVLRESTPDAAYIADCTITSHFSAISIGRLPIFPTEHRCDF